MALNGRSFEGRQPAWAGWVRPVFIAVLTLLLFLLALSMKHHHFMDGARYNNRSAGTHP
jgi:hypothetical protein